MAGQVVYSFRTMLRTFWLSDNVIALPFVALQEAIYDRGVQYLPAEDGERGVWTDTWFVYLYSKNMGAPKGTVNDQYSPKMIALLDTAWSAIEQEASFPYADRQMERQHYFRNFPGQTFYYHLHKGYYAGNMYGSRKYFTRDDKLMARSRKLVRWLSDLPEKWQSSQKTMAFIKKHPKVDVIREVVLLMELSDVIINEIMTGSFSCSNDSVRQYLGERQAFVGDGDSRPAYLRMRERAQAKRLYDIAINSRVAMFQKYILSTYCGEEAAGEVDLSDFTGWGVPPEEFLKESLENLFSDELKQLEEWANGR